MAGCLALTTLGGEGMIGSGIESSIEIVVTFFSPSGYEIRKNYSHADRVFYLPIDTKKSCFAGRFTLRFRHPSKFA